MADHRPHGYFSLAYTGMDEGVYSEDYRDQVQKEVANRVNEVFTACPVMDEDEWETKRAQVIEWHPVFTNLAGDVGMGEGEAAVADYLYQAVEAW